MNAAEIEKTERQRDKKRRTERARTEADKDKSDVLECAVLFFPRARELETREN